ncbi:S1 RNA-binding domain-containing protein [Ethanoligenens harbinense]|uniref:RNA binding S1 domain protein n=1 Tax=Ethanoligenens harbinense (strain DSM 18485 / JCM 12961 / CGMCC 1.5033 / YUAN-3) TaxID=663278 RepID=E6U7T3_ETHHY|nr:S1 RNA-binding domain-containing protein [Ethanoligenens harbinense]ADU28206.1 RNA binding S1 domain protein [Ethanoligenens harbinense YUAN-3]AVQ97204.1 30S ribosomal protein S1 [Ethanoligenens harbinense YUAN-3]AYF39867.1 30S ribosomal protein S1 [Ethanoligenens harbinense]AYF42699.1 30S ribosomal protein S1 [Ethanoligenens harbinense]QCN93450.1 30S ribosomal protein S1 [Ethanoligenens harbinense]
MAEIKPEGWLLDTAENREALRTPGGLLRAKEEDRILEARALVCDSEHNLIVDLDCMKGIIPRQEGALGLEEGTTRDIAVISRVNKAVCFKILDIKRQPDGRQQAVLSRRAAQQQAQADYISRLTPGDVIDVRVTHLEPFGAFVDIGCGIPSLIPIDLISISRISHPRDRFHVGQDIKAVVKSFEENRRVCLSHKELLGTWEENAARFSPGETVAGIVRSQENYGVFVELSPNLAGLAEPREDVHAGQSASVFIKNLIPEKMKVKLIIVDAFDAAYKPEPPDYFISSGHIDRWQYSPSVCTRVIETVFNDSGSDAQA